MKTAAFCNIFRSFKRFILKLTCLSNLCDRNDSPGSVQFSPMEIYDFMLKISDTELKLGKSHNRFVNSRNSFYKQIYEHLKCSLMKNGSTPLWIFCIDQLRKFAGWLSWSFKTTLRISNGIIKRIRSSNQLLCIFLKQILIKYILSDLKPSGNSQKIKWKQVMKIFNSGLEEIEKRQAKDLKERWDNSLKKNFKK